MKQMFDEVILISGMHRSGTTFAGRILSKAPKVTPLHEPFNAKFGLEGVKSIYQLEGGKEFDSNFEKVRDLDFRVSQKADGDDFVKGMVRYFIGGRTSIDRYKARLDTRLYGGGRKLLIKDPFLMAMAGYLSEKYSVKSLITVRHPVAVWNSIKRMGWKLDFGRIQGALFFEKFSRYSQQELKGMGEVEKFSVLYDMLYRSAFLDSKLSNSVKLVKHEDICFDPQLKFEELALFLGVRVTSGMREEVDVLTRGEAAEITNEKLHNFTRDSKALSWSWCKYPESKDERIIAEITGGVVEQLYGFWRPN
jgi:hypothetical protein